MARTRLNVGARPGQKNSGGPSAGTSPDLIGGRPRTFFVEVHICFFFMIIIEGHFTQSVMPFNVLSVSSILYLTRFKSKKNVGGPPAGTSPDVI